MTSKIKIVEMFSSIQGEGLYVGCRQVFVRLAGCNLKCDYCDTPLSQRVSKTAQIELSPGLRDFNTIRSIVDIPQAAELINNLLVSPHHSVSLTGGEPLCQSAEIVKMAPLIKGRIFLETNGTLVEELAQVLPHIDIISMDIKPPSSAGHTFWVEHKNFLRLANTRNVYVKLVLTKSLTTDEFEQTINLIAEVDRTIPLVLQPVTPVAGCIGVTPEQVLRFQETALHTLVDVRVIPQTHKYMGQI